MAELLGLSRHVIERLIEAGYVTPRRGPHNARYFSFEDLVLLRTADSLQRAQVSPRKIVAALAHLRATLPREVPLTGLRIAAVGREVVVRDRAGPWDPLSGQVLMDFEVTPREGSVAFLGPTGADARAGIAGGSGTSPGPSCACDASADSADSAGAWFDRAVRAESDDLAEAEQAYRRALALDPGHADAAVNLSALLSEASRSAEAAAVCSAAIDAGAPSALLHFNHAIALEDLGRIEPALAAYRRALALDPTLADAHFNLGRLLEQRGDMQGALRHFGAYRRARRGA